MTPAGWTTIALEDFAAPVPRALTDGPFGSNLKTSHYTERGPRVVRLQNIGDGEFRDERAHISHEHYERLTGHAVAEGDVLIALLGDVLPRSCVAPAALGAAIVKADCVRLRVHSALANPAFVSLALNADPLRRRVEAIVHGVGRPRLTLRQLRALELPLPPRAEQDRICSAADQQLSRIASGMAGLRALRSRIATYRASVLKAACEGRLVPTEAELARAEGRDPKHASAILDVVRCERDRVSVKNRARLSAARTGRGRSPEVAGLLPAGWDWVSLGDVVIEPICNGLSIKGSDSPPGVAALRLSAMSDQGFDYSEVRFLPVTWSDVHDLMVREHDFFVSRGNGSLHLLGRGTLAQDPPLRLIFPDTMMRLRLPTSVGLHRWISCIWASPLVRRQIERRAKTTAGIFKISQGDLAGTLIPLPPASEQRRIVAEVERRLSVADQLEATIDSALARAKRLRQSILSLAFSGRLVPQDPNDEPASVLLERIRKEREAKAAARPKRTAKREPHTKKGKPA